MANRRRVLLAFEAAERDLVCVHEWITFVIVGAGPTGMSKTMWELLDERMRALVRG